MLKSIKVSNFGSIGSEQELNFLVSSKDILNDSAREIEGGMASNLVSCIIGHNAAGKTTVLKALAFLLNFVEDAYSTFKSDQKIMVDPHKLMIGKPTSIEIEFLNHGTLYRYILVFNNDGILFESLEKKAHRRSKIFTLNRESEAATINTRLKINETDKTRFKERRNVPLLSSLISTGYLSDITFFSNFMCNVSQYGIIGKSPLGTFYQTSDALHSDETLRGDILNFSKEVDFGISNFEFMEADLKNEGNIKRALLCTHKVAQTEFELFLFQESNGTQRAFSLLAELLPVLKKGGLAILDEIETGLHPYVVRKIISLFESKDTNPLNAQLIFSTHQHLLLNDRTKTQIFLAEKTEERYETEIYRLDDVEGVRNDENYFHKYLAGAYGGVAKINWI